jgi:hypothetical protein
MNYLNNNLSIDLTIQEGKLGLIKEFTIAPFGFWNCNNYRFESIITNYRLVILQLNEVTMDSTLRFEFGLKCAMD